MSKIETLKNKSGESIYPLTSTKAVVDENGNTIEGRLVVADGEDLVTDGNVLRLKDRPNTDGMGYVILRKEKTFQEQVTKPNTIYEIRYDFDLGRKELPVVLDTPFVLPSTGGAYYRTGDHINVEAGMTVDLPSGGVLFDSTLSALIPAPYTPSSKKSLYVGKLQSEAVLGHACVYSLEKEVVIPENCVLKFEGGSLRNGTVVGDETVLQGSNFLYHVFLSGLFFNRIVDMRWYKEITIREDEYNNGLVEDGFLTHLVESLINEGNSDIKFGCGIYGFTDSLTITNVKKYLKIIGEGEDKTCLFFPKSKGFFFKTGDLGNGVLEKFMIHSQGNCIQFYSNTSSDRFNAVHDTVFSKLRLLSNNGDYAIGADKTFSFFLYHNIFRDIQVYAKSGFVNLSGLGTLFDNVIDNRKNFLGKSIQKIEGTSLFYNCNTVVWQNSNTSYTGIDHIYYLDFEDTPSYGCIFHAKNCNMEGVKKEFIYTNGEDGSLNVHFEDCVFISSIDPSTDYYHMVITVPASIIGVTNRTAVLHNTDGVRYPLKIKATSLHLLRDSTYSLEVSQSIYQEVTAQVADRKYINSHHLVLEGKKNYFTPRKYLDAHLLVGDYSLRPRIQVKLSEEDIINPPYGMYYELIADKDNYTFTLPSYSLMQNYNMSNISTNGNPIVFYNRSNFCIVLKNQLYKYTLLPRCYYVWFAHNVLVEGIKKISHTNGTILMNVKLGDTVDRVKCVKENSGFYSSAEIKRGYQYSSRGFYDDFPISYNTILCKNGYVYMCIQDGVTATEEITYPTDFNTMVDDGTARFVCIGKSAEMIETVGSNPIGLSSSDKGFQFFDTTLGKPIWWNGTEWVDALGRRAGDTYNEVRHIINGTEIKVISTDAESQGLSIYAPTELENDGYVVVQQDNKAKFVDPADIGLK